jgi:tRNA A-37 threonylcarbamoyl transferase component Bud32
MILVSKAISDMHNNNIIHNDLNWSNIIPIKNKNNDIEIYIIDINRSKFKRKGISINNRLKDLQRLNLNGSNKKIFFETYCRKTGYDYNILTKKY